MHCSQVILSNYFVVNNTYVIMHVVHVHVHICEVCCILLFLCKRIVCVCVCGLLNAISVCGLKYFIYLHIISQLLYCLSFIFIVNSLKEIELNFYH